MGQVGGDVRRKAMTDDGWQDQPGHERGQGEQFQGGRQLRPLVSGAGLGAPHD
jgi:hypothetical protein